MNKKGKLIEDLERRRWGATIAVAIALITVGDGAVAELNAPRRAKLSCDQMRSVVDRIEHPRQSFDFGRSRGGYWVVSLRNSGDYRFRLASVRPFEFVVGKLSGGVRLVVRRGRSKLVRHKEGWLEHRYDFHIKYRARAAKVAVIIQIRPRRNFQKHPHFMALRWRGMRCTGEPDPNPRSKPPVFSGAWVCGGRGVVFLRQSGRIVSGSMHGKPGQAFARRKGGAITGQVDDGTANLKAVHGDGTWSRFRIKLTSDGRRFTGTWSWFRSRGNTHISSGRWSCKLDRAQH